MVPTPLLDLPPIPHHIASDLRVFQPVPPTATPKDHYHDAMNRCTVPGLRYIRKNNAREMLIYIAGACSYDGTPQACAGYGVKWSARNHLSSRLEGDGPETSDRAELRAAIVALGLRVWHGEGFDTVVLACDSEYVVEGISQWVREWKKSDGWPITAQGALWIDGNQDLWEVLFAALREQDDRGVLVQFWVIWAEDNESEPYAKAGAFEDKREHMEKVFAVEDMAPLLHS